jgi:2-oxoglutarate ferredoxin oxidoreductase subunit beta
MKDFPVYNTYQKPSWCPGCGNFGIWYALKAAFNELGFKNHDITMVFGIGCSGNLSNFLKVYGFHSIHGRTLPVATGIKLANHKLNVIATSGDGDGLGIGLGHFIHTSRRNLDITYIIHNNKVYGLTTGQTSPTSPKGFASKSTPFGVIELPVNPIALAIISGATFVARGYSGEIDHLTSLIVQGIKHKGFAVIDVLQPCVTFNPSYSYPFYNQRIYKLEDAGHDPEDFNKALALATENNNERIPIGVFYKSERETYEEASIELGDKPLTEDDIEDINIDEILEEIAT